MTKQELIDLINNVIKQNGNDEITGQILNAVLLAMVGQSNDLIGDFNNTTITGATIIDKINSLSGLIENASGIKLHSGPNDPNVTPPISYNVADFYAQTVGGVVIDLYQYNGVFWVNQQNVINDSNVSASTTYSSEKINQLLNNQDGVINVTSITVAGNLVTIGAGSQWRIGGVIYTNANDVTITVPYAAVGYVRLDNLLGNTSNTFELQQGIQTTGIAVAPLKPANKFVITQISVNENSVNNNGENNAKLKSESDIMSTPMVGDRPSLSLYQDKSHIILLNANSLQSLSINEHNNPYPGKIYTITNNKTTPISIYNNGGTGNVKFLFPDGVNYNLKPKESIQFFLSSDLTKLNFLSSNISSATNDEHYVFNSIISVTAAAAASPSYHYRNDSVMNLSLNTSLTNPADLVSVNSTIVDLIIPYNCRLTHVSMVLPNVYSFNLALVNNNSINPDVSVRTLKQNFTSTGASFNVVDQNTEHLNIDFIQGHGIKLFCMASSATPAPKAKGGYINLTFKKI